MHAKKIHAFLKWTALTAMAGWIAVSAGVASAAAAGEANSWTLKNGDVVEGTFLRIHRETCVFETVSGNAREVPLDALVPAAAQSVRTLWGKHLSAAVARIDDAIENVLREQDLEPNPPLTDEQFLRRAYLNVAGTIPTYDETRRFLLDRDPQKRFNLVSTLLQTEGHVSHMYNFYADLFRIQDTVPGTNLRTDPFSHWIKDSVRENKPYDAFVYEMLAANGRLWDDPAAGFMLRDYDTRLDHIQYTAKVLLGTDLGCAQCHDDPFQEWRQMDYYRLTAFLSEIETEQAVKRPPLSESEKARVEAEVIKRHDVDMKAEDADRLLRNAMGRYEGPISRMNSAARLNIAEAKGKRITLPPTYDYRDGKPGDVIMPLVPFGDDPEYVKGRNSPREQYARWMTSPENPRFAMNIANRIWGEYFGRPVAIPLHRIDPDSVENPELLKVLEAEMVALGFDLETFVKVITTTKAYQRQSTRDTVSEADPYYFQGPVLQRMSAEQVWDSLMTLMVEDPLRFRKDRNENLAATANLLGKEAPMTAEEYFELAEGCMEYDSRALRYVDTKAAAGTGIGFPKRKPDIVEVMDGDRRNAVQIEGLTYGELLLTRASELSHPIAENHFLRKFGQSERNFVIGAASRTGSVPQIMEMMNGFAIETITKPDSMLFKKLKSEHGRMEKADIVFMSILNRKMDQDEREKIYDELEDNRSEALGNLIWALLNTPEFFFIK